MAVFGFNRKPRLVIRSGPKKKPPRFAPEGLSESVLQIPRGALVTEATIATTTETTADESPKAEAERVVPEVIMEVSERSAERREVKKVM